MMRSYQLTIGASILFCGCATITSGTTQTVTVETIPAGAVCKIFREGKTIGFINPTPGSAMVEKSGQPLGIECSKEGYKTYNSGMQAQSQPAIWGNILLGGIVGILIDSASGAYAKYDAGIAISLEPIDTKAVDRAVEEIKKQR